MNNFLEFYGLIHFTCFILSLSTKLFTDKYILVRNILWSILFGPIYMVAQWSDLDSIVIDIRPRDNR